MIEGQSTHEEEPGGKSGVEIFVGRSPGGVMREFGSQEEADAWEKSFRPCVVHGSEGEEARFENPGDAIRRKDVAREGEITKGLNFVVVDENNRIVRGFETPSEATEWKELKEGDGKKLETRRRNHNEESPYVVESGTYVIESFETLEAAEKWERSLEGRKIIYDGGHKVWTVTPRDRSVQ